MDELKINLQSFIVKEEEKEEVKEATIKFRTIKPMSPKNIPATINIRVNDVLYDPLAK